MRRWSQLTQQPVGAAGQVIFKLEFLCEIFDEHPAALEMIKPVHVTRSIYPLTHGESGELAQEVDRIKARKARYRAENKAVRLYWS